MSWLLPIPLLIVAGVVALLPLASLLRRPVSLPRLIAEAFGITVAVIGTFWVGWVLLWLLEPRW
jgi:hypothetical protein